jgi:endonuclease-3 related protein
MVGAVLVQNTTWKQAARAVAALKESDLLRARSICDAPANLIGDLIRSSGFFRIKALRLKALSEFVVERGGPEKLNRLPTPEFRERLLEINGVGPETADAILLYAFDRPLFVADAYSRRILARVHGGNTPDRARYYDHYRERVETCGFGSAELNEFHALLVAHARSVCLVSRPRCNVCTVATLCRFTGNQG